MRIARARRIYAVLAAISTLPAISTTALAQDMAPAEAPTEAPATEAPTTEAPTTEAPTEAPATDDRGATDDAMETIVITGTKKKDGQSTQEAPLAVTAFGEKQLDAFQFKDIESLTFVIPNVALDDVATFKGVANFSIRGLGINSSIPSIDPTVGVFVDGVYLGVTTGVVLDTFDLEAVEVLRGPQGVLFGRNVTGGAVVLRSRRPAEVYGAQVEYALETGLEHRVAGGIDLPLVDDLLAVRLAGSYRTDAGWFENDFDGEQFGAEDAFVLRPSLTLRPTDDIALYVMYERNQTDGDGPAAQSRDNGTAIAGPHDGFDFSIDERGFARFTVDFVAAELTWDLGDAGQITDVFGWRRVDAEALSDIDSQPAHIFHGTGFTEQSQISNELRYYGAFAERFEVTAGVYVFQQDIVYRERRNLLGVATMMPIGAIDSTFGGDQEQLTLGAFGQAEVRLVDELRLIAGVRYSRDEKSVEIATFSPMSPCGVLSRTCTFDFEDDETWDSVTPKVGLQWMFMPDNQVYAHYTRGFRSGGYNFRNTSPTATPGPFDDEVQDAYELGVKSSLFDRRLRISAAGFVNRMSDLQREVNVPDQAVGVVQIIENTADADIFGAEADVMAAVLPGLVLTGSIGVMRAEYTDVRYDLNGDGATDAADEALSLPRFPELTATAGALYEVAIGDAGVLAVRGSYAYRDETYFTDNNVGILPGGHVFDASVGFRLAAIPAGGGDLLPSLTLYGRNLFDTVFIGGQTPLPAMIGPAPLGGNFSPLKEGRVLGVELRLDWTEAG